MRVLVTGGAGFIGTNVCRALLDTGQVDEVVVLDDLSTGFKENLDGLHVEFIQGSLLDLELVERVTGGATAVIHLGALGSVPRSVADPLRSHHANATGTINLLDAARRLGSPHVVIASSSSVYGAVEDMPKHEALATRPMSPYAASKLATEWYGLAFQHSYGLPVLAFRFFNVYGPFQPAGHAYAPVLPAFISAALSGMALTVHGDGHQSRDFTYVGTVAETIVDAVLRQVTCDTPVNLAFGTRIDLMEIIEMIHDIVGHDLQVDHTESRAGDMRHTMSDPTLLRSLFPDIEPVDFPEGLARTVDWWRDQV
jgi:UDP-glucose 4-epimerase